MLNGQSPRAAVQAFLVITFGFFCVGADKCAGVPAPGSEQTGGTQNMANVCQLAQSRLDECGQRRDLKCSEPQSATAQCIVDLCIRGTKGCEPLKPQNLAHCSDACLPPIACAKGGNQYQPSQRCDGRQDCEDDSDELGCLVCEINRVIPSGDRCDGKNDCGAGGAGVDELGCFLCADGARLAPAKQCNGTVDCAAGEDEQGCETIPCDGITVLLARVCDGFADCPSGLDERDCPPPCTCESAPRSRTCCDRINDCPKFADESNCP